MPPGGVLELDETPETGVVREVLEETGVAVKAEALTGVYKNMRLGVVTLAFRCHVIEGVGHATDEAAAVAWLGLDEVRRMTPQARAVRVLDAFRQGGPFVRVDDGARLL